MNLNNFFWKALVLQCIFIAVTVLDIPVARQVFGSLFLLFIPGLLLLKMLRFKNLQLSEVILLSVGLSIAFLMFTGLLLNEISPLIGVSDILTEFPLVITLNGVILLFCFLTSSNPLGSSEEYKYRLPFEGSLKQLSTLIPVLPFLLLPLLSILGAMWVNAYESNLIIVLLILTISGLFLAGALVDKFLPSKLYPIAILMISVSLLFHFSLVSRYVISGGSDILLERSIFMATKENGRWQSLTNQPLSSISARFDAMLSITILPTILSNLLRMDDVWILKILYPIVFSFVPLSLYCMWQTRVGSRYAFISAFLFMAQQTFYTEMLGLTRQMVAELFFGLLFLVLLSEKIDDRRRIICFIVFGAALIVSHYAMSLIFLFYIIMAWIALKKMKHWTTKIDLTLILLFFTLMFSWYIYTSNSATFSAISEFGNYVYDELDQWANPASRGTTVLRGLGMEEAPSIWNSVSRAFAYVTQILIVLGLMGLVTGRQKANIDREYFALTLLAMMLLSMLVIVPGLAETLNMTRFYHILLFFLAPLAALGGKFSLDPVLKSKKELAVPALLVTVLIPYFLFQTSFVYEVVGVESWSLPLSKYRTDGARLYAHDGYIDEQSAFGAQWLREKVVIENTQIYADLTSRQVLFYFAIRDDDLELSNATKVRADGVIYLNRFNLIYGKCLSYLYTKGEYYLWSASETSLLYNTNVIYSNGGSQIHVGVSNKTE